jgi:hypothetical protein
MRIGTLAVITTVLQQQAVPAGQTGMTGSESGKGTQEIEIEAERV